MERVDEYRDIVQGVATVGQRAKSVKIMDKNGFVKSIGSVNRTTPT